VIRTRDRNGIFNFGPPFRAMGFAAGTGHPPVLGILGLSDGVRTNNSAFQNAQNFPQFWQTCVQNAVPGPIPLAPGNPFPARPCFRIKRLNHFQPMFNKDEACLSQVLASPKWRMV